MHNSKTMFEYKKVDFFTKFFQNHPDFNVKEEFSEKTEKRGGKKYISGKIEVKDTIHPILLEIEIPLEFPHKKLRFWTKSLFGYPHLIPDLKRGEESRGSWFCLNTPFAETPEEQLNQEILRLREWIGKQLNNELPACITDPDTQLALKIITAYEWENPEEVNEVSQNAIISFMGDWNKYPNNFKEKKGFFHCIKTPGDKYFIFNEEKPYTKDTIPYLIEDSSPEDFTILRDFIKLKAFYNWDSEKCEHLFPGLGLDRDITFFCSNHQEDLDEETALSLIKEIQNEIDQEETFLPVDSFSQRIFGRYRNIELKPVPPSHKKLIREALKDIEKEVKENKGLKGERDTYDSFFEDPEDEGRQAEIDQWVEHDQYIEKYCLVGFPEGEKLFWVVLYTNPASKKSDQTSYNIKVKDITIDKINKYPLDFTTTQNVTPKIFFGRGALCSQIADKKNCLNWIRSYRFKSSRFISSWRS